MKNSCRALLIWSLTLTLFDQVQRPMRSGVCRLRSVCRVSEKSASVSTPVPPVPGASRNVGPTWKFWALLNENPGDHVVAGVLVDEIIGQVLRPAAADVEGAPIEALVEVHLRGELRGRDVGIHGVGRSEERRVGKECRSRWSPYH